MIATKIITELLINMFFFSQKQLLTVKAVIYNLMFKGITKKRKENQKEACTPVCSPFQNG